MTRPPTDAARGEPHGEMGAGRRAPSGAEGGFVMALVVLMLFAISVAGTAAYLIVSTEFTMARYSSQGNEALGIARGGLNRFVAEQLGPVADSARYAIGGGEASIRARKVAEIDEGNHVYYLRAEGTVDDPAAPANPAVRVVGAYAYHRIGPMPEHAAVIIDVPTFRVHGSTEVSGDDIGSSCPGGTAPSITGAIARDLVTEGTPGVLTGNPASETWPGGYAQMYPAVGLRWDVLSDPTFPVSFEDAPPSWGSLPADSFPVIRRNGSLYATGSWSGRGVLIVTGKFDSSDAFSWEGIVLAGWVDDRISGRIDGILVGGLADNAPYTLTETRGPIRYHSCNVDRANASLSHLELMEHTVYEAS